MYVNIYIYSYIHIYIYILKYKVRPLERFLEVWEDAQEGQRVRCEGRNRRRHLCKRNLGERTRKKPDEFRGTRAARGRHPTTRL